MKHQPFEALVTEEGFTDSVRNVFPTHHVITHHLAEKVPPTMTIYVDGGRIHITKAQCMEFFGLVEASTITEAERIKTFADDYKANRSDYIL
jgi:hypothetical protein